MKKFCKITIKGQGCNLEFDIKKSNLYTYSLYFRDAIDQGQTNLTFSNSAFDKNIYTLYFSEFHAKNIPRDQINSDLNESVLHKLLELNEILQSDTIKEKIYKIFEGKQNVNFLIQKISFSLFFLFFDLKKENFIFIVFHFQKKKISFSLF